MHRYRSHTCGALRESDIDQTARCRVGATASRPRRVAVHRSARPLRPHAMRRRSGLAGLQGRRKTTLGVGGADRRQGAPPSGWDRQSELPTGAVELYVSEIEVLGPAGELPLPVFGEQEYPEDIRLKFRFLDLRREKLHQNIMTRGAIVDSMRKRMKSQGFFEFQTPILTASIAGRRA